MAAELKVRQPAVAGRFYGGSRAELERELEECFELAGLGEAARRRAVMGVVAPHAGYYFSGMVAAKVFGQVEVPDRVLVLGPNHTGMGLRVALFPPGGAWRTPLGDLPIDDGLTRALYEEGDDVGYDEAAHLHEHSIEVEVPFLQRLNPGCRFAAMAIATHSPDRLRALGAAVARALERVGGPTLLVASTDMHHFDDQQLTLEKDQRAIDRVLAFDPDGLLEVCARHAITMCGVAPTAVTLHALRERGATKVELVDHRTSGDRDGRRARVVGYAGFLVS